VGEGGCSPSYFLDKMSGHEVAAYLRGMAKRQRSGWEQVRLLCRLVYKVATGEDLEMDFPWEDAPARKEDDEAELAEAWKQAKAAEAALKKRKEEQERKETEKCVR
jgi:hypothetical protein